MACMVAMTCARGVSFGMICRFDIGGGHRALR